jgi:hypothetical protein
VVAGAPLRLEVTLALAAAPRPMAAVMQPLTSAGPSAKLASSPFYCPDKILSDKMQADDHNSSIEK